MVYFLDTNIVLRLFIREDPEHDLIRSAIETLEQRGETLTICLQVLVETWVVATRPLQNNGLGWSTETALQVVTAARSRFNCLLDNESTSARWLSIVDQCKVGGKRAHDARIAAVMASHGVTQIVTLNEQDFAGFPDIVVTHPRLLTI